VNLKSQYLFKIIINKHKNMMFDQNNQKQDHEMAEGIVNKR